MSFTFLLDNPLMLICTLPAIILVGLMLNRLLRRRQSPALNLIARQTLLDSLDEGMIIVDQAGRVVEYNSAAVRMAALAPAANGQPLANVTGDQAFGAALTDLLAGGSLGEHMLSIQLPQQSQIQIALTPLADASGRQQCTLLKLRSLAEPLPSETAPAQPAADLTLLHEITAAVDSTLDLHELLQTIVSTTRTSLGIARATVALLDEPHSRLTIAVESDSDPGESIVGMHIPLHAGAAERVGRNTTSIIFENPSSDDRLASMRDLLERRSTHTLLVVPLRAGDRLLGTFNLASSASRRFDPQELMLMQIIAGYIATALTNAQLVSAVRQADRAKSTILDAVSHEFRTPITVILGFTELYQENILGPSTEAQQEALEAVQRNAHRLLKLVDDLLDLARLETASLDLSLYPLDVALCIREATGMLASQIKQKQLDLRVEIAEELPLAWADAAWLRRVLINLLSNALRFTSAGTITVRAYEVAQAADAPSTLRRLAIEIEDTGQGISTAEQQLIFEAFQRASDAQATALINSGAGLGLAISKRAIDQMDGQLTLRSQPGQGSTFTITLQAAELALEHQQF